MKTRKELFAEIVSPLPNAVLKKYPQGNIMQYWAENVVTYSTFTPGLSDYGKATSGHRGVDLATFEGDLIVAPCNGKIGSLITNNSGLGGNFVTLFSETYDFNGKPAYLLFYFGHCKDVLVKEGDVVVKGQPIATEGNTGFVVSGNVSYWNNAPTGKGVHLHFQVAEYYAGGEPVFKNSMGNTIDPLPVIMYKNPDYTGTQIFLANMMSFLRSIKTIL